MHAKREIQVFACFFLVHFEIAFMDIYLYGIGFFLNPAARARKLNQRAVSWLRVGGAVSSLSEGEIKYTILHCYSPSLCPTRRRLQLRQPVLRQSIYLNSAVSSVFCFSENIKLSLQHAQSLFLKTFFHGLLFFILIHICSAIFLP